MKKYNCFAMDKGNCTALTATECSGCAFYATRTEMKRRMESVNKRLDGLDSAMQMYLADKYYDGERAWCKGKGAL